MSGRREDSVYLRQQHSQVYGEKDHRALASTLTLTELSSAPGALSPIGSLIFKTTPC